MNTPNKERIQMLVDALRSGQYKQGRRKLRKGDCYCCLGVACEVFRKATGEGEWDNGETFTISSPIRKTRAYDMPQRVVDWFGFDYDNPNLTVKPGYEYSAIELNDNQLFSFLAIADAFENTFLKELKDGPTSSLDVEGA